MTDGAAEEPVGAAGEPARDGAAPGQVRYAAYLAQSDWVWWHAVLFAAAALLAAMIAAQLALAALEAAGVTSVEWQMLAALGVSQVVSGALIWWGGGQSRIARTTLLALRAPVQGWKAYLQGYLAMLALFAALSAVMWAIDPKRVMGDLTVYAGLIRSEAWWLAVVVIAVGAPVMEELMFRGFLFPALANGPFGIGGAAVATSAAWAALHANYSVMGLVEVFAVGLYFTWLLLRTGSLRVPMFCHGAYNLSVLALIMAVDIPALA